jgi:hypothetical protein
MNHVKYRYLWDIEISFLLTTLRLIWPAIKRRLGNGPDTVMYKRMFRYLALLLKRNYRANIWISSLDQQASWYRVFDSLDWISSL